MFLPILAAGLILAADNAPALQPSAPTDIASAVRDCWQAVVPGSVDRAILNDDGWSKVDGTAGLPLQAFIKAGANHLIVLTDDPAAKDYCTVITRLSSKADEIPALEAMLQALKADDATVRPERTYNGVAFASSTRFAEVNPTDAAGATAEQPAMRIIVGYKTSEQK